MGLPPSDRLAARRYQDDQAGRLKPVMAEASAIAPAGSALPHRRLSIEDSITSIEPNSPNNPHSPEHSQQRHPNNDKS